MDKYVYIKENVLSKEICNKIIKLFEEDTTNQYAGTYTGGIDKDIKNTINSVQPLFISVIIYFWAMTYQYLCPS